MAEPGWYQDPLNPDKVRWWDGNSWTEHEQPVTTTLDTPSPNFENTTDYFTQNPAQLQGESNSFVPFSRSKAQSVQEDLPIQKPSRNRSRVAVFLVIAFLLVGGILQSIDSRTSNVQPGNVFSSAPSIPGGVVDDTIAGALGKSKTEPSVDNSTALDPVATPTKDPQPSPTKTGPSTVSSGETDKPTVKDRTPGSAPSPVLKVQPPRSVVSVFSSRSGLVVSWKKSTSNPKTSKYEVTVRYGSEKIMKVTTATDLYLPMVTSEKICTIEIRTVLGSQRSIPVRSRCGS